MADSTMPPDGDDPRAWPDDYLMTRAKASRWAAAHGVRISISTLAKLAGKENGPLLTYIGAKPYCRVDDFRIWLHGRMDRGARPRRKR
jgi:hypothetical protein